MSKHTDDHDWVRGRTNQVGLRTLYFKRCRYHPGEIPTTKKEWDALPASTSSTDEAR